MLSGQEAVPPFLHHSAKGLVGDPAKRTKSHRTKHELGPGCEGTVHFRCFPTPGDTWALGVTTGDYLGRDFPL